MKLRSRSSLERMSNRELLAALRQVAKERDTADNAGDTGKTLALSTQFEDFKALLTLRGFAPTVRCVVKTVIEARKI